MGYVLDTNVLNRLIDGRFAVSDLPADAELIASHIQIDELNRTSDEERRARLFLALAQHVKTILPTETAVWDVSRWDNAKWGEGPHYAAIKADLDLKNRGKSNNIQDALIAEIALVDGHVFVTADRNLADAVKQRGGSVVLITP